MKIDICHIYPITSGTAGTYINSIYNALKDNFSEEIFVNYYFPYKYGKRIFYKYSDLCAEIPFFQKHNFIRKIVRFFEMSLGLYQIYKYIKKNDVKLLNYSLNSDLFIEFIFLKAVKSEGTKVAITCHDVLPFGVTLNNIEKSSKLKRKKRFFSLADYLIVHNNNSVIELLHYYNIKGDRVILSPFPIMDITLFYKEGSLPIDIKKIISNQFFIVSMVGFFRKEKGLNILIEAWKKFIINCPNAQLIVAGHFPNKIDSIKNISNIHIHEGFLNDNAYAELIKKSNVVVMPYIRGTNSGIPSSILSMDTIVLTSDIEMFKMNSLISEKLMFKTCNSDDLAHKLSILYNSNSLEIQNIKQDNNRRLKEFGMVFKQNLVLSYEKMLG